jgi:hypothetical protein
VKKNRQIRRKKSPRTGGKNHPEQGEKIRQNRRKKSPRTGEKISQNRGKKSARTGGKNPPEQEWKNPRENRAIFVIPPCVAYRG